MAVVSVPSGASTPVPALTVAQATSSTDMTQGAVSGQVLAQVFTARTPADILTAKVLTVTTNGQSVFTLPSVPTNPATAVMFVNNVDYSTPSAFSISGSTLTWSGGFNLSPTDDVRVNYV